MEWIVKNYPLLLTLSCGLVSEIIAIRQLFKYPTDNGAGGILAILMKILVSLKSKQ